MSFTQYSQIYVNGLGEWFRVLDQNDKEVRLASSAGSPKWYSKKEVEGLMKQSEPDLVADGF